MDRPKRNTRKPVNLKEEEPANTETSRKRKAEAPDVPGNPAELLKTYLESSRSPLTKVDLADIINPQTWGMLSDEARNHLKHLLLPTAFEGFIEEADSDHPAWSRNVSLENANRHGDVNPSFFGDGHFLAAARSFQDHLFSNWLSDTHQKKVSAFKEGIVSGSLAAPWKDEEWEHLHPTPSSSDAVSPIHDVLPSALSFSGEPSGRVGGATAVRLVTLTKAGVVRVGDVLAYKRTFATSQVIEKDCIIQSIHPITHAITVLAQPGLEQNLPTPLLCRAVPDPTADTRTMTVTSPSMLETGILDLNGRMEKSQRPNGNAWKCFTIWRWRNGSESEFNPYDSRGGRENHGTLFYLRNSYYHES